MKFSVHIRATLRDENGNDVTWEDWSQDFDVEGGKHMVHTTGSKWFDVQNAIEEVMNPPASEESR